MNLFELSNSPSSIDIFKNTERHFYGRSTINDRQLLFKLDRWPYDSDEKWNFVFIELDDDEDEYGDGTFKKTGSGKEFEVFATVKAFLEMAIREKKPDVVFFEASKTEGLSRAKLYASLVKRWIPSNYIHKIVGDEADVIYHALVSKEYENK